MTIESILNSELQETVGSYNVVMKIDGVFFQFPFITLKNDPILGKAIDYNNLFSTMGVLNKEAFEQLRREIMRNRRHFGRLFEYCRVEHSKLTYK